MALCHFVRMRAVQRGVTLVELMVALAIGVLITVFAMAWLVAVKSGYVAQGEAARIDDTGRTALANIARSLRQAGFEDWGATRAPVSQLAPAPPSVVGFEGGTLKASTSWPDVPKTTGAVNGSDILAIRFGGAGAGENGDGTMLNCAGFAVPAVGSQAASEALTGWSIYYVAQNEAGQPELYCKYRGDHGWNAVALAEGVESFQVLYGVDMDGDGIVNRYVNATELARLDAVASGGKASLDAAAQGNAHPSIWSRVAAVRVALLVRGTQVVGHDLRPARYDLFGRDYGDRYGRSDVGTRIDEAQLPKGTRGYGRRVFETIVHLRNVAIAHAGSEATL
ncbi:prepilin-type N-terminal cleavage/methylation domain-containing protein [Oxalobacteraceae bacterium OM1]|nr:prepilin-type N-terminal cleavage/methylation domain-containing protein [Oxalobacteraceae bacterium OM1]